MLIKQLLSHAGPVHPCQDSPDKTKAVSALQSSEAIVMKTQEGLLKAIFSVGNTAAGSRVHPLYLPELTPIVLTPIVLTQVAHPV